MKRKLLITLFAFGTVAGFGSGFASLACHHERAHTRRAAFERHVADLCVQAADRARAEAPRYEHREPPHREHRRHHRWGH